MFFRVLLISLLYSASAFSLETDQYTLPPRSLKDVGPFVSSALFQTLKKVEQELPPGGPEYEIAARFKAVWGAGIPTTKIERWLNGSPDFSGDGRYRPRQTDSIYNGVRSQVPYAFGYLAPTLNLYGVTLGSDKLGHIAQQGYEYYKLFLWELARGGDEVAAQSKAVAFGVFQEETFFGTALDGVYSNGDLAANFTGLKFYLNLTRPVRIGDRVLAPIFLQVPTSGADQLKAVVAWKLNPAIQPAELLKPFITWHLNEAMNPSLYFFSRAKLAKAVADRCLAVAAEVEKNPSSAVLAGVPDRKTVGDLTKFFGEDYGHSRGAGLAVPSLADCVSKR